MSDLEAPGAFSAALAERAVGREVILLVFDLRHIRWAHNLLLNLADFSLASRALAIGPDAEACSALRGRVPSAGCGCSSYLRAGRNATVDAALRRWKIGPGHVYHLWWQRWRYMARAVEYGYSALSLDSDISLRADPYLLFHGALAGHRLLVGLDSERRAGGRHQSLLYPAVNVGLVYANRCAPGGPAHELLREVTRRAERFLLGPLMFDFRGGGAITQNVMWEQDLFKDSLEHLAYGLDPSVARHTMAWTTLARTATPAEVSARVRAERWGWRFEPLPIAPGRPPQRVAWLPIGPTAKESVAGLPLWVFSPYNVPPHGAMCDGRWAGVAARTPSPVMVGHLVGCQAKFWMLRLLGWYRYDVETHAYGVSGRGALGGTRRGARAVDRPASTAAGPAVESRVAAFPPSVRVLVLSNHSLPLLRSPSDQLRAWGVVRRYAMLALLLGRRAVLPTLRCRLSPCGPSRAPAMRPSTHALTMADAAMCEPADGEAAAGSGPPAVRGGSAPSQWWRNSTGEAAMGWAAAPEEAEGWRRRGPRLGCCQLVPTARDCLDMYGGRHALATEPLLCAADLARLLSDARASAAPTSPPVVGTAPLGASWTDASFDELRASEARVLVLDGRGEPGRVEAALPPLEWIERRVKAAAEGGGVAIEDRAGARGERCLANLLAAS